jgi:Type I phosphodiesterase / nucleotide pyrophosphatase/Laminin B (Domain IV)
MFCLAILSWPTAASAALAKYVVLIDWDGFEPTLLNRGYSLPNLANLASKGSLTTTASSTFQSFSNPARASMSSGAYPERQGNVAWVYDPSSNTVLGQTRDIATGTIAEALRQTSGMTMASVQWYMVQNRGVSCGDRNYLYVQPGGEFPDRVKVAIDILHRRAVNSCGTSVTVPKIPNLLAVYGPQPDELSHNEGTNGPNMKTTMETQDQALGQLIQATKDVGIYRNTAFILTTDHGMSDWTKTALNVLSDAVTKAGYSSEVVYSPNSPQTNADVIISPAVRIAHFYLRGAAASDPNAASKIRDALLTYPDQIEDVIGPSDTVFGQSLTYSYLRASPKLGDLVAEVRLPYSFAMEDTLPGTQRASHGSRAEQDTPLYLAGKGISHTKPNNPVLVDVAPTIAALLGIPCPAGAQGRVLKESFTSSASCTSTQSASSVQASDVVVAQSTFDTTQNPDPTASRRPSREGWTVVGDPQSSTPAVHGHGGDPEAFISTTDAAKGETQYWKAPDDFLGNRKRSYGSTLSFDLRQSGPRNRDTGAQSCQVPGDQSTSGTGAGQDSGADQTEGNSNDQNNSDAGDQQGTQDTSGQNSQDTGNQGTEDSGDQSTQDSGENQESGSGADQSTQDPGEQSQLRWVQTFALKHDANKHHGQGEESQTTDQHGADTGANQTCQTTNAQPGSGDTGEQNPADTGNQGTQDSGDQSTQDSGENQESGSGADQSTQDPGEQSQLRWVQTFALKHDANKHRGHGEDNDGGSQPQSDTANPQVPGTDDSQQQQDGGPTQDCRGTGSDKDVVLRGAGLELSFDLELDPSSGKLFSYYEVPLQAANTNDSTGWTNDSTGKPATADELRKVLGSLSDLLIRAEYANGSQTVELDNVVLRERAKG